MRWSPESISKIQITPLTFKSGALDQIEESQDPQAHAEPGIETDDVQRQSRRLRILDADVRKYGFTESCQRCDYLRQGKDRLAKGIRHNEECREHTYDALRAVGADKLQRADLVDSSRTATRPRRGQPMDDRIDDHPVLEEAPTQPLEPMDDNTPNEHEPNIVIEDTSNFHEEVDADQDLEVEWEGDGLHDGDGDHIMSMLVNVLQTNGVSATEAVAFAVNVIKDRTIMPVTASNGYNPTFFEMYGHGNIVKASHGSRRNLNVNGLRALDLRTSKPDGQSWDFNKPEDRKLAKAIIEIEKPIWLIGSPPCTFSAHGIRG